MLKCSEEERKERHIPKWVDCDKCVSIMCSHCVVMLGAYGYLNYAEKPLGKQPFKCPICGGNGLVTSGFYNQTSGYLTMGLCQESCRSCGGTGIVWRGECK